MIYLMTHFGLSPSDWQAMQFSVTTVGGVLSTVIKARLAMGKETESDRWRRRMCVIV